MRTTDEPYFTPGPWRVNGEPASLGRELWQVPVVGSLGHTVAMCYGSTAEEALANAQRVAAAGPPQAPPAPTWTRTGTGA